MQKKGKNFRRLAGAAILTIFAVCFLISDCTQYNPSLYPSYDVLNPGQEVRANPLSVTEDGNFVVNEAFLMWVQELKEEVIKLRKQCK